MNTIAFAHAATNNFQTCILTINFFLIFFSIPQLIILSVHTPAILKHISICAGAPCQYVGSGSQISGFMYFGGQTWKQCLRLASKYGAMSMSNGCGVIFPSSRLGGWTAHRQTGPAVSAMYAISGGIYASQAINASLACYLVRDGTAGFVNNLVKYAHDNKIKRNISLHQMKVIAIK